MDINTIIVLTRLRVCLFEIKKYFSNEENIKVLKGINEIVKE